MRIEDQWWGWKENAAGTICYRFSFWKSNKVLKVGKNIELPLY